jgi:hypothetical protein
VPWSTASAAVPYRKCGFDTQATIVVIPLLDLATTAAGAETNELQVSSSSPTWIVLTTPMVGIAAGRSLKSLRCAPLVRWTAYAMQIPDLAGTIDIGRD